jgi:small-conductance mechanosensitive channel
MNDDKRSPHASSLRTFFDEQLDHLQNLVGSLGSQLLDQEQQTKEDRQIVESFVDASNSKMRAVQGYAHKLREHVRALHDHALQVAERIPPPVDLNQETFGTDPLVNALFASSNEIDKVFATDSEVNAYVRAHSKYQVPVMYALLTASKSEKKTLGVVMQGDMLIRDVPQQAVNFSSYKIHAPCAACAELSTALKEYLFSRVVALIKQEMTLQMTDQVFKPGDVSYESRVKSLANPDVYLDTLIEYLEVPAKLLSIDKLHFKLSKLGIKLAADDGQSANEFDIHELTWCNNARNVMLQIAFTR